MIYEIDALGMACPKPLMLVKNQLGSVALNETVCVMVDNKVAVDNINDMAKLYEHDVVIEKESEHLYRIFVTKKHIHEALESTPKLSSDVYVIGKDELGAGAQDLGRILIKGYIYALSQLETLPSCLIFLNAGAKLTANDSNVIADLAVLEQQGVKIMTCGTCINYYGLDGLLAVGQKVDMYQIVNEIANASKVVSI